MFLPDHIVNHIALYAHPTHPCKWEIDYFRHMVYWVSDGLDWSGDEFKDWVKWRETLDRNGHSRLYYSTSSLDIFDFY